MIEFALVLPMTMVVITGIFTFGFAINNYLELTNAVTIAAQDVAISRGSSLANDPCKTATTAITTAAPQLNPKNLTISLTFTPNGGSAGSPISGSSCTSATTDVAEYSSVQVQATYPCVLAGYGFNIPCKLAAQVSELIQ